MAEYRIVTDRFAGFEVQARRWWWPFWVQCGVTNTHRTIERAERYAHNHACGGEVKRLGRIACDSDRHAKRENSRSEVEAEGCQSGPKGIAQRPTETSPHA